MDRVEHLVKQLEAVKRHMDALGGETCPLMDEKVFVGTTTPEGDACRIKARAQYLLDILICELFGQMPECCEQADKAYCIAWDACDP